MTKAELLASLEEDLRQMVPPPTPAHLHYDEWNRYSNLKRILTERINGLRYKLKPLDEPVIVKAPKPQAKGRIFDRDYYTKKKQESRAKVGCKDCGAPRYGAKSARCLECATKALAEQMARKNISSRFRKAEQRRAKKVAA